MALSPAAPPPAEPDPAAGAREHPIVDVTVIGGGPAGMVCAFEAGLREASAQIIEALPELGGQLTALYPEKVIYDVPGFPRILARDLVANCVEQGVTQFDTPCHLGQITETITEIADPEDPSAPAFRLTTDTGDAYLTRKVVITAGNGAFEPRRPDVEGLGPLEAAGQVRYSVLDPDLYRGRRVVIVGGGDSALDWAIELPARGAEVSLVHRSNNFRAVERSMAELWRLREQGRVQIYEWAKLTRLHTDPAGTLTGVTVGAARRGDEFEMRIACDALLPLLGFKASLGPLTGWGITDDDGHRIPVDWTMETRRPGVFAVGDVNHYPGKLKLIATGFGEAPIAVNHAIKQIRPDMKLQPKHTTTAMPGSSSLAHPG